MIPDLHVRAAFEERQRTLAAMTAEAAARRVAVERRRAKRKRGSTGQPNEPIRRPFRTRVAARLRRWADRLEPAGAPSSAASPQR